jgi:leucyl aminopeptidase
MRLVAPEFLTITPAESRKAALCEKFDAIVLTVAIANGELALLTNPVVDAAILRIGFDFADFTSSWPQFGAQSGELVEIPVKGVGSLSRIYVLGVGEGTREEYRKAGAAIGRKVKSHINAPGLKVLMTSWADDSRQAASSSKSEAIIAFICAISLSHYGYSMKKSIASSPAKKKANTFLFTAAISTELEHAKVLSDAVWNARDLIHTPSNIKNPEWIANQARALAKATQSSALTVTVKSGRALGEFGGLRAVGNSAPVPGPRLIEMKYAPTGSKNWPHIVLVGKGITFDTGGISLKRPYDAMVAMKSDMAGVAAILAATCAITAIKPKVRITSLLMCAENMVSGTAQRPSDIISQYGGTTVEVLNTDAEGRLVLADGLAYADLELDPDYLIDVATLTGAASMGLGKQYAAMYTRDSELAQTLAKIGEKTNDRVWHMPLVRDYEPALESTIADLAHVPVKAKFSAGSVTAALFLEKFVGDRRWVHLDIAGPGRSDKDAGEFIKGGTAFATRLLIEWLATFA